MAEHKRSRDEEEEEVGPAIPVGVGPAIPGDAVGPAIPPPKKKRRKKELKFEQLYLDALPSAQMYEFSYMHRDTLSHVRVASTDYVITGSVDGHVKFWKKKAEGIEFVKHYRAHKEGICGLSVSSDGQYLASVSTDRSVKIFDVIAFDLINMFSVDFEPSCCVWAYGKGSSSPMLAIASFTSGEVSIFDAKGDGKDPMSLSIHLHPVVCMEHNAVYNCVISVDLKGVIEYWDCGDLSIPRGIAFEFKGDTDLFTLAMKKSFPLCLAVSKDGEKFAVFGRDRMVRVFSFRNGKMIRSINETLDTYHEIQASESSQFKLESFDFGRRMAIEKELDKIWAGLDRSERKKEHIDVSVLASLPGVAFDATGNFLFYPSLLGIKVVNLVSNKLSRVLGKVENTERFLGISLYQGRTQGTLTNTEDLKAEAVDDPHLFCTAYKRSRFYMFTKREPLEPEDNVYGVGRDIFNERPPADGRNKAAASLNIHTGNVAVIHTTLGDITIKLFTRECPKTFQNFTTHAQNGFYNGHLFHRIIKGFMIQTGDPKGDGTGGTSIWGDDFEDEFHRDLRHDRPFTVSMANAGPNTNGSQFFITTVPCPRLDNKHTVFGRVTAGMETVMDIEKVSTDKFDKPYKDVRIVSITLK